MNKLRNLKSYCPVYNKLNNNIILIGNPTEETIEKFRKKTLYDADDLYDWFIEIIKEINTIRTPMPDEAIKSYLSTWKKPTERLMEIFGLIEDDLK